MNKMTRRIMVSVLTLVLTVVALGTTTFAWFSLSNVANVSNIGGEVVAGEGLEIAMSLDGTNFTNFKSNLGTSDWDFVLDQVASGTDKFSDVLSLQAVNIQAENTTFKKIEIQDNGTYKINGQAAVANQDYIALTLKFRTKSENKTINVTNVEFVEKNFVWASDADFTDHNGTLVKKGDSVTIDAHKALRLTIGGTTFSDSEQTLSTNGQHHYLTSGKGITFDGENEKASGVVFDGAVLATNTGWTEVDGYNETTLVIYVWVDGFDINAYDAIFKAKLAVNFRFALAE